MERSRRLSGGANGASYGSACSTPSRTPNIAFTLDDWHLAVLTNHSPDRRPTGSARSRGATWA